MPEIDLVDHSFQNNINNAEISIQTGLNGFSFCITSLSDKTIRAFRYYSFKGAVLQEDIINKSAEILRLDDLLQLQYRQVRVFPMNSSIFSI